MTQDLKLLASFGYTRKEVVLNPPYGAGGYCYFVMIDKFLQGQAVKTLEGWRVYLNNKSLLSPEDCQVICETIEGRESD